MINHSIRGNKNTIPRKTLLSYKFLPIHFSIHFLCNSLIMSGGPIDEGTLINVSLALLHNDEPYETIMHNMQQKMGKSLSHLEFKYYKTCMDTKPGPFITGERHREIAMFFVMLFQWKQDYVKQCDVLALASLIIKYSIGRCVGVEEEENPYMKNFKIINIVRHVMIESGIPPESASLYLQGCCMSLMNNGRDSTIEHLSITKPITREQIY